MVEERIHSEADVGRRIDREGRYGRRMTMVVRRNWSSYDSAEEGRIRIETKMRSIAMVQRHRDLGRMK